MFGDWVHGSQSKWLEAKVMRRTRNKTEKWPGKWEENLDSVVAWVSGKQVFQQVQLHMQQSHLISDHQISAVKKTLAPVEYAKFWGGCLWIIDGHKKRSSLWFKCIILLIYSFELILLLQPKNTALTQLNYWRKLESFLSSSNFLCSWLLSSTYIVQFWEIEL